MDQGEEADDEDKDAAREDAGEGETVKSVTDINNLDRRQHAHCPDHTHS